jgi:hypothetical protein
VNLTVSAEHRDDFVVVDDSEFRLKRRIQHDEDAREDDAKRPLGRKSPHDWGFFSS